MTHRSYIALLRKDDGTDFGVNFPDFPGCISAGSTLEEARQMAQEALEAHVSWMVEDGEEVPPPTALDAIMADSENRDGVAILVDLKQPDERVVRVNITLPQKALELIDEAAEAAGQTRSGFILRAAQVAAKSRHAVIRGSAKAKAAKSVARKGRSKAKI